MAAAGVVTVTLAYNAWARISWMDLTCVNSAIKCCSAVRIVSTQLCVSRAVLISFWTRRLMVVNRVLISLGACYAKISPRVFFVRKSIICMLHSAYCAAKPLRDVSVVYRMQSVYSVKVDMCWILIHILVWWILLRRNKKWKDSNWSVIISVHPYSNTSSMPRVLTFIK